MVIHTIPKKILDKLIGGVTTNSRIKGYDGISWISIAGDNLDQDGIATSKHGLFTASFLHGYDGISWSRLRINAAKELLTKTKITDGTENASVNTSNELNVNATDNLETKSIDYAGAQNQATIITPTAGKALQIHDIFVSTNVTNVDIVLEFTTSTIIVFKLYTSQQQSAEDTVIHIEGAVDEVLKITCGAGTFVSVTYHEV